MTDFTEHRFDKDEIKALVRERAAALKENRGFSDFPRFALGVVERRLQKDPARYRDYGPYWWALKELLVESGRDMGERDDPMVRRVYRGSTDSETIVMADEFRTQHLATQAVGTSQFILDADSGNTYTLEDEDMDSLAPASA